MSVIDVSQVASAIAEKAYVELHENVTGEYEYLPFSYRDLIERLLLMLEVEAPTCASKQKDAIVTTASKIFADIKTAISNGADPLALSAHLKKQADWIQNREYIALTAE